ncbi:30S ribosomal protein S9 [Candidatus Micrarchaeota archaeon]|nr:30S ribosomal protein S9 [Candidatus Micrarchaeota archaeon]
MAGKKTTKKTKAKKEETKTKAKKATKKKKTTKKKKETKALVARGKRKRSIARATIREGSGVVRLNSNNVESITNSYIREIITEPLRYVGPETSSVNISVNVQGGGVMGQAQAARTAIAKALTRYFEGLKLREKFIEIDRSLLVEDTRRVEPKKYRGPKARARYQKSYR